MTALNNLLAALFWSACTGASLALSIFLFNGGDRNGGWSWIGLTVVEAGLTLVFADRSRKR